ncbi:hypothetical protein J3458_000011 [Metarhizium acridum]|uniref:uncharacterized protein n=1 Tax=Metarhizium acridum TaxID=92637 RepID=UPI001C6B56C4|nr:hypothetical protein J3458_000011 [Metarhizium acridum]
MLVAAALVFLMSSIRKFEKIAWLTWLSFLSVYIAVFIVVYGLPPITVYFFSLNTSSTLSVLVSHLKAVQRLLPKPATSISVATSLMLRPVGCFTVSRQRWIHHKNCVVRHRNRRFGYQPHAVYTVAKYLFVRILRNSDHLQKNSWVHWTTRLGCTLSVAVISFLVASGIPIYNYLLALAGSLTFAPLALGLPSSLWIYDHGHYRKGNWWQITVYLLNWLLILLAVFMTIAGTYGVVHNITDAYADSTIGQAFSCADNGNSS